MGAALEDVLFGAPPFMSSLSWIGPTLMSRGLEWQSTAAIQVRSVACCIYNRENIREDDRLSAIWTASFSNLSA